MRGRLGRMGGLDRRQETESRRGIPDESGCWLYCDFAYTLITFYYVRCILYTIGSWMSSEISYEA